MRYHQPVLVREVLDNLKVKRGRKYIDCTLGEGGHTIEILKKGGKVLGIDLDENSLERAGKRIEDSGLKKNFIGLTGNFKDIDSLAKDAGFSEVHGVLYDLGFSLAQLEDSAMGLSFDVDQPLDMRLDKKLDVTAGDLVNVLPEKELERMFREYGGERLAKRFAEKIVKVRSLKKLESTKQLAEIISDSAPPGYEHGRLHPATRVFQALRIAVNNELESLKQSLPRAARLLLPGGRMVVISFHSLDDRVAKEFGRGARLREEKVAVLAKKPIRPTAKEIEENSRARSAKMRVFEKI